MNMDFGANKTLIEVIKEGAFGGTYVKDIYSDVIGKWYRKSWKEFNELIDIIADIIAQTINIIDVSVNKHDVKWATSLRFWENKGWIKPIDLYGWFQSYFRYWFGRRLYDGKRQIAKWKGFVNRFKTKLIKIIKDVNGRFYVKASLVWWS